MGLDVSVYRNLRKPTVEETENEEWDVSTHVDHPSWKYKMNNFEADSYYMADRIDGADVRYSYSSHSFFRNELCRITNWEMDFDNCEELKDKPFYEMINFTDCDGCLDWEIASILYKNFCDHEETARKEFNNRWFGKYQDWKNVFKEGKEVGSLVDFH